MIPLNIHSFLDQVDELELPKVGYPYVYSDKVMMKLFLYALVHDINGFKTLQRHLAERPDVLRLVGLSFPPHRTTLGKRFKALPESVRVALQQVHQHLIEQQQSDPSFSVGPLGPVRVLHERRFFPDARSR